MSCTHLRIPILYHCWFKNKWDQFKSSICSLQFVTFCTNSDKIMMTSFSSFRTPEFSSDSQSWFKFSIIFRLLYFYLLVYTLLTIILSIIFIFLILCVKKKRKILFNNDVYDVKKMVEAKFVAVWYPQNIILQGTYIYYFRAYNTILCVDAQ